jgi:tetratricopeptide (TPR) repeat protein
MKRSLMHHAAALALAAAALPALANPFAAMFGNSGGSDADSTQVAKDAAAYAAKQPAWARPYLTALYRDGEWGAVLNLNRLGLAAMQQQQFGLARKAFDQAIVRVEAIYADDPNAAKARSAFNGEKVKDFKGEPYERAMMYYYRGLLYLQEGDYQNARAAFLAADRHDTLSSAEEKAFAGDFGLMKYLAGWASACDGDTVRAEQLVAEAQAADATVRALPKMPGAGLVLLDSGPAPVKWGDGQYKHILKIKPGEGSDPAPQLRQADGGTLDGLAPGGDIGFQASTRGGREIDGILAGKAQFKDTAGAVGDGALVVGSTLLTSASMMGDSNMANIGMAGLFIGLVAKGIEKAANPEADVRGWDTLPAQVLVRVSPEPTAGEVLLVSGAQAAALPLQASHGRCSVAWGRTRPAVVDAVAAGAANPPAEAQRGDRNRAFRAMLVSELTVAE